MYFRTSRCDVTDYASVTVTGINDEPYLDLKNVIPIKFWVVYFTKQSAKKMEDAYSLN